MDPNIQFLSAPKNNHIGACLPPELNPPRGEFLRESIAPHSLSSVQIDLIPKLFSYKPPNPNASHWTSHRLKINTFSRMPSARAQSNLVTIYSSPSSDSASTLYSPRLYKHPISLGRPLNPGTLRRIAATCRFAPSMRLVQTTTCVPNTAEPCPILVHTKSALCGSAPHGACDCPRRLSYKLSSRCIALPKLYATYARCARDLNKAYVDIAQSRREI